MIRNYLLLHLRSLWRNRSHGFINILGLSLGITCAIVIFLIVRFELSHDDYHDDNDRIFRVVTEFKGTEKPGYSSAITYPLVPAIRQDFPDAEYVTLVDANMSDPVVGITRDDGTVDKFKETKVAFVDPEFLKIFKVQWISGNADALQQEKTVVLTESMARKYFGNEPAFNRVIHFNSTLDLTVTGVIQDPPLNTDLPFRVLISFKLGADKRGWDNWGAMSSSLNCFVKLNQGVRQKDFEAKLKGWHLKYFTGDNEGDGKSRHYFLQPLNEMHFDARFNNFAGRIVSYDSLITLTLIGVLLLLTACINFINLNTVLIVDRSKEAGVRKVMGCSRAQLVFQFLGETFTITMIAMFISTGLVELALVNLPQVLGYRLAFSPLSDPLTLIFLLSLPLLVTLLAGLYPGISLSRFQPVKALKSKMGGAPGQGLTLRRALIVFQLVISQVLIVCTIIVVQQIDHFMNQPIGINSHAVVEFELPESTPEVKKTLNDRLKQIPGIENTTMSNTGATSENQWTGEFAATVNNKLVKGTTSVKTATEDYIDTYGITLLYGENLVESDSATRFLVSETFARKLGYKNAEEAIGTPVDTWGHKALITGVVKDFNASPLHYEIQPTIIYCDTKAYGVGTVRLSTNNLNSTLDQVRKTWEDVYPDYVFQQSFLDETIAHFYDAERRSSYLIGLFAGVAIFIGCIGLFGLVSFMARRKTKEVGIRKTLGASVGQVVALFSREFMYLILISFAISVPIAFYFMDEWLTNFKYRIHPNAGTFLLGVAVTLVVVMLTVGIKSYRAAVANPVDALRDE